MGLEDFEVMECLGTGAFARVDKVRRKQDGKLYALKRGSVVAIDDGLDNMLNEIKILASFRHPRIVRWHETFIATVGQDGPKLYIDMELCAGGDLEGVIRVAARADGISKRTRYGPRPSKSSRDSELSTAGGSSTESPRARTRHDKRPPRAAAAEIFFGPRRSHRSVLAARPLHAAGCQVRSVAPTGDITDAPCAPSPLCRHHGAPHIPCPCGSHIQPQGLAGVHAASAHV